MRLTYTDIQTQFLSNIGKTGTSDSNILTYFTTSLASRYQTVLGSMHNYMTQRQKTDTTVQSHQFYKLPPGVVNIEDVVVTIGSVNYPLSTISSQTQWDKLNAIQIQPSAIPQFIFPRYNDYGIWPIPQDAYTITFNYHFRDRSLLVADSTFTAGVTASSATITGTGFTSAIIGRFFVITDTTSPDYGYWYRISGYTDSTTATLSQTYQGVTNASVTAKIGQTPEIPEEGHRILVDGVTADYFAGMRNDPSAATWWDNMFWTGQGNNNSRDKGNANIAGGLIGLCNAYSDRNNERLIVRQPRINSLGYQVWATTISA